jgi:hypothetical protein
MKIKEDIDMDGDPVLVIEIGHLTVWADTGTREIYFHPTQGGDCCSLTGFGAWATVKLIRPAVLEAISWMESRGIDWRVSPSCPRRAKLYKRYFPRERFSGEALADYKELLA